MIRRAFAVAGVVLTCAVSAVHAAGHEADSRLDAALLARAHAESAPGTVQKTSRVIIRTTDGGPATLLIASVGGVAGPYFRSFGGQVARVPDSTLDWLASQADVAGISLDRAVRDTMDRTATAIGARWVADFLGVDGTGVGVATIDSGITALHHDLDGRVVHFADFVNAQTTPYDDYGHGTHVAGIIAGMGSNRTDGPSRRGIAPGAHLVVLKALDIGGNGYTSNVIAAIDYAIANRITYNIRVINLSVAAGIYESYAKDPLTLAAKRAVDAGIVVVAAAGNRGQGSGGVTEYGGITSPGNAPWVLTVGAGSDGGTVERADDVVAGFSSRGPAAIDRAAKPDIVAHGVAIESTSETSSALYAAHAPPARRGAGPAAREPYMTLTGTSMAAPVVTGAIALMLEANPALTPNAVKAILQFTAETRSGVDHLTQGGGFLNARGAVALARALAGVSSPGEMTSDPVRWSRHIIWGNLRIGGAMLNGRANAWALGVTWGEATSLDGETIDVGLGCALNGCGAPVVTACDTGGPDCLSGWNLKLSVENLKHEGLRE
jgi:serine protease AprX